MSNPKLPDPLPKGWTVIPTGQLRIDANWGATIIVDVDKAPCPYCWGEGVISVDDGYDEDGNLTPEYDVLCPRCKGNGLYKQEVQE